jgi:hypothetical protein
MLRQFLNTFDIYQFEHTQFATLIDKIPRNKIIIYNAHNVEYDYTRYECHNKFVESVSKKRIYFLEKKMVGAASHIFSCSQDDKKRFHDLYETPLSKISIAPNGISPVQTVSDEKTLFEKFPKLAAFPRRAIYSGSNVAHNHVAVDFILKEIAPFLSKEYAFIIHGTCGVKFIKSSASNVFFDLDDQKFKDYACPNTVGLNPVIQGSGTNLKVLNYLNHRLHVVSTPFGMRGYDDLKQYVTIASSQDFVSVLKSGKFVQTPNLDELNKKYEWRNIASHIKSAYLSLLDTQN